MTQLRKWQSEALEKYRTKNSRDFLVVATPGAGKTTFALTVARKLLNAGAIKNVIVVTPTDHLRTQWAEAAIPFNIFIDPTLTNADGLMSAEYDGYACTYAQVASAPELHVRRVEMNSRRTLVIFDEIHHAGDGQSWGEAVKLAFDTAGRRLSLTGTPFRTDSTSYIPFVRYEPNAAGDLECVPDYEYGYKHALKDGVVRPVTFAAYSGVSTWMNSAGEVLSSALSGSDDDSGELERQAWSTALSPKSKWIPNVIAAADKKLEAIKKIKPDAAAMILASDQESAKAYAKILTQVTGKKATVILSEDNKSSLKIEEFKDSKDPGDDWMIAVRMVSEGVDVPRLAVGIWATNYRTPLFFAQAIGRFVRIQKPGEVATVFIPAVKPILVLAHNLEETRKHVLYAPGEEEDEDALEFKEANEANDDPDYLSSVITPIDAEAEFTAVIQDGKMVPVYEIDGLTEDEYNYLGITELLDEKQVKQLISKYRSANPRPSDKVDANKEDNDQISPKERLNLRRDISKLVNKLAFRSGRSHAEVHKTLMSNIPGPPSPKASGKTLKGRLSWLEKNLG